MPLGLIMSFRLPSEGLPLNRKGLQTNGSLLVGAQESVHGKVISDCCTGTSNSAPVQK